jgi:hypothetical protein
LEVYKGKFDLLNKKQATQCDYSNQPVTQTFRPSPWVLKVVGVADGMLLKFSIDLSWHSFEQKIKGNTPYLLK